jgi:hypothetical protein
MHEDVLKTLEDKWFQIMTHRGGKLSIRARWAVVEDGCLIFRDEKRVMVAAVGPGMWESCTPALTLTEAG